MTKKEFLDDFAEELQKILRDVYTKNAKGEEVGVSVYKHRLPVITEDEDDESKYFPYAIARLSDADTDEGQPWKQRVYILLGVYDDDLAGSRISLYPDYDGKNHRQISERATAES